MDNWTPILEDPHLIQALGYTVLHSLWQGSIIAILYGFWLKKTKQSSEIKYVSGLYALVAMVALSSATFMYYFGNSGLLLSPASTEDAGHVVNITYAVGMVFENPSTLVDYMPLISNIWLVGMLIYSIRIVLGGAFTFYLRTTAIPIFNTPILKSVKRLSNKMEINKKVEIAASKVASSPLMIGHIKPLILMPIAMINALNIEEVEAIISHELAHIKRNDYLVNLLQTIVEVLYYYHPAVYYISEQIRAEREHCCDDIAIKQTNNSLNYAKVLVKLQEIQNNSQVSLAMHFKHSNHIFMNRIKRLLQVPSKPGSEKNRVVMMLVLVLLLVGVQQSAHSISRSIENRLLDPIDQIGQIETSTITPIRTKLIEIDTTPKVKTIVKKKTITIIDGDSTITEIVTESDGNDGGFHLGDDNVIRWFSDGEKDFTLWVDSLREDGELFNMKIDSMPRGLTKLKMFLNDGESTFNLDSIITGANFDFEDLVGDFDVQMFHMDSLINRADKMIIEGDMMFFDGNNLSNFKFKDFDKLKNLELLKELENLEEFEDFEQFKLLEDNLGDLNWIEGGNTPADKINRALNRDGLLEIGENNKVELSGKQLKINGDKQPKNIHSKYKRMWEDSTGVSMSKSDKVTLELKGEEHVRKMKRF